MRSALCCGLAILLLPAACRLERRKDLYEDQHLVARLDNSKAFGKHLEQEYEREVAHVNQLQLEVAELMAQEEALALEAEDIDDRIDATFALLDDLDAEQLLVEQAVAAQRQKIADLQGEIEATRTPPNRAQLEARVAVLESELVRLRAVLAALPENPPPASEPAASEPAASEPPSAPPPAAAGGGG